MKNIIIIDIDTEREQSVKIGKPESFTPPTNKEEAKNVMDNDILCVVEALCSLIHTSDQSGYTNKSILIQATNKYLGELLEDKNTKKNGTDSEHTSK